MSKKRLWLRISESDEQKLDVIAEAIGGVSRSSTIRFLIRQWISERNRCQSDTQVAKAPSAA